MSELYPARQNTREVNPYSRRYTLASFTKKYFPGERVSPGVAKSFWDDFRFGYQGGLGRYIKETTWVDGEQLAKKNGPTLGKPHYPFAKKEKQYAKYADAQLYHAMNDAMEASRAQQGWNETGANWYLDDYHTIVKEIQRRKAKRNSPREGKITLYEGQVWTGPGRSHWSVSLEPHSEVYAQMRDEFTREIVVPLWLAELAEAAKGDTMAEIQFLKWLREEGYIERTR